MKKQVFAVSIEGMCFHYPAGQVFEGLCTKLKSGCFTSIIGPNGAGKTTLLRLLTMWLKPSAGTIMVKDRNIQSFSQKELGRTVAFVKQEQSAEINFSVFEMVLMGRYPHLGRFRAVSAHDRDIVLQALEMTHTVYLKDRSFNRLSSGEAQRVLIARALAQQTEILLLDEPISHLDLKHQVQILLLLKRMQRERNLTIVTVLHDLNSAAQCSDDIILLSKGKIHAQGTAGQVLSAENIKTVYGIEVEMAVHPRTDLPFILPFVFN
jgi:iron complex transport system ATP-binding protein